MRKPGAFRRYIFREWMFPRLEFRRAYDALVAHDDAHADFEYVRILHMAAEDGEQLVESVLEQLRTSGVVPEYDTVRERVRGPSTPAGVPDVPIEVPNLLLLDRAIPPATELDEEVAT